MGRNQAHERFDRLRREVAAETIVRLVHRMPYGVVDEVLSLADIRLDARYVRDGVAPHVVETIRTGPTRRAAPLMRRIGQPVHDQIRLLLEDGGERQDLHEVAARLVRFWDPGTVALVLSVLPTHDDDPTTARFAPLLDLVVEQAADIATGLGTAPEPGPDPGAADLVADSNGERPGESDPALLTQLDELLIRQAVATYTGTIGSLPPAELHRLLDEVVALSTERHASFFHLGFVAALDGDWQPRLPDAAMNDARWRWLRYGQALGYLRRGEQQRLAGLLFEHRELMRSIVRDGRMGRSLTASLVLTALQDDPQLAAGMLGDRLAGREPFSNPVGCLLGVHDRARRLLLARDVEAAEALWAAVSLADRELLARLDIDVSRRLVNCARARNDYVEATRRLDAYAPEAVTDADRALIETERGLIAAEISHLDVITVGRLPDHRANLQGRLSRGRASFERALELEPRSWRAALCLGMLLVLEEREHARAANLLDTAASQLQTDPLGSSSALYAEVRFHAALERLSTLEPGLDGRAYKEIGDALEHDQWSPAPTALARAVGLLTLYGSRHAPELLARAADHVPEQALLEPALQLIQARHREVLPSAVELAGSVTLPGPDRLELLFKSLDLAGPDSPVTEALVDALDTLIGEVQDDEVDRRLTGWLATSDTSKQLWGSLEVLRMQSHLYARLGNLEVAAQMLASLLHRTLSADTTNRVFDPKALLEELKGVDTQGDLTRQLTARVQAHQPRADTLVDDVRLVFVGGDERQQNAVRSVQGLLEQRFGDRVHVTWIHPGWESNWAPYAERVEALYPRVDGVVLMRFMRTNLGRRLRRSCGEAELPWFACPGHGTGAIGDTLNWAVQVINDSRR